jgi:uncharacterized membrane protein YgaE (UPF0421/DUF939 family)
MDTSGSMQRMKLRAFDLSERTVRSSRASAVRRADRWKQRSFLIAQCSVTAGLAWYLAGLLPSHTVPFFAPVAAIITLGMTYGQRLRRGVEVAIGVALGVAVGDLWVWLFGTGVWQIMAVCAIAMSLATLLGAGQLMTIQAGVQSIIVTALSPDLGYGVNRWLDAVIGCALALLIATIAPSTPLRKPGQVAARVLNETADVLVAASSALRNQDGEAADVVLERARAGAQGLTALDEAAAEGLAVVRHSPFRRRQLSDVTAFADLYEPLDHASRNLRVLARRSTAAVWRGREVPSAYLDLIDRLAATCRLMANELDHHRLPTAAKDKLRALPLDSSQVELSDSLDTVVILAQTRSMIVDLLELTGMDYQEARELVPELSD